MADVEWIKLTTDMFDNKKIKYIRTLPEGNNIVLIWVMLLTMAGRCNASGMIFITENIPYNVDILADELRFEKSIVTLALNTLAKFGMIICDEEQFCISNWEEYQNVDGMERIKEQTRLRVAKHRDKKKQIGCNVTVTLPVTQCNAGEEEIEEDKEYISKDILSIPYSEIVDYLNKKTGKNFRSSTPKTQKLIKARWNEGYRLEDFFQVIDTKCSQWLKDTKMNKYLQPETLFGTKFEGYLNENVKKGSGYGSLEGFAPTVTETDIGDFD